MSLPFPGLTLNQVTNPPTGSPTSTNVRTALVMAPFPSGPALSRVKPSQVGGIYGSSANALTSGFQGPQITDIMAGQTSQQKAYDLEFVCARPGATSSTTQLNDNASGHPMTLSAIGAYFGSAGSRVQVAVNAPQAVVYEATRGGFGASEVYILTFYGLGGTPTGGPLLSYAGGTAGAALPAATARSASLLQTYLQGLTGIGSGNVLVTALATPLTSAFQYKLTFAGTLAGQALVSPGGSTGSNGAPLLAVASGTWATGTGIVPVQSIVVSDTLSGATLQTYTAPQGTGWTVNTDISTAINNRNDPYSTSSVLQAGAVSLTAGVPITQTVTLAGGIDGIGAPYNDGTIAALLSQVSDGNLGDINYIVTGYDAANIAGAVETFIGNAGANNIFVQAYLGPGSSTGSSPSVPDYTTLTSGYQSFNSQRIYCVGQASLPSSTSTAIPGWLAAAALCGKVAITDAQFNLYRERVTGLGNAIPRDPTTGVPYTLAQIKALHSAGFIVFQYSRAQSALVIYDLINTAQQTAGGVINQLAYKSVQDCYDMIARGLLLVFGGDIEVPTDSPGNTQGWLQSQAVGYMQGVKGRYHNGASVSVAYDPTNLLATVTIGYGPRSPLVNIVINLGILPGFSA